MFFQIFYGVNKVLKLKFLLIIVLFFNIVQRPLFSDWITDLGFDALSAPDRFFHGYQYEAENLSPSFFKKHLSPEWREVNEVPYDNVLPYDFFKRMSISFTPSTLILSVMNYSIKGHILSEGVYVPQITLDFSHQFYVPLYKKLLKEPTLANLVGNLDYMSFSTALILSKSMRSDVKFYGGYRFAYGWLDGDIENYINRIAGASALVSAKNKYTWKLHDLIVGIGFLLPNSNWETSTYLGFDPSRISVFLKLEFANRFFGVGLGYYPNNILIIRPYFRFFYDFI